MDIAGSLMGLAFFMIIFIPIIIINKNLNKRRKLLVGKLYEFASKENKTITEFDSWTDNSIIGMSTDKEFLFFLRNTNDYNTQIKIPVNNINKCYFKETKINSKVIEKLEVVFEMNNQKDSIILEFFKADAKDFIIGAEMRIAKKWIAKITEDFPKPKVLLYNV